MQEFLVQLLSKERNQDPQQNGELSNDKPNARTEKAQKMMEPISYDILADPLMFLRKWMGEVPYN